MNRTPHIPRAFHYAETSEGQREAFEYALTPAVCQHFLDAFQDNSPLHVDEDYARSLGFRGRVMHGSLLNGFISHFVGTWFPGRFSLLLGVDLRFSQPSYLGDVIRLEAVVSQKMNVKRIIVLDATLTNQTQNHLAARGRIQAMIKENA
jgi:acyl dehydratase